MSNNDITGDRIVSKGVWDDKTKDNFDRIFKKGKYAMKFKVTYEKDGVFKDEVIVSDNLTAALHKAENSGFIVDGWEFIGVEVLA